MSRKLVALASAALISAVTATGASAQAVVPPASPTGPSVPVVQAAPAQVVRPATAEQRAVYDRADPLARSVVWAREVEINPADADAGVKLSRALRELGQSQRAVESAQAVLAIHPDNVEAMLELGRAQIARGQAFYGIAALERARDLAPNDWRPLSLLGIAYEQVRRSDEAREAWNAGLRLSPDNPTILSNAAMSRMTTGDVAGAEVLLRRAVAQPGASLQVRQNLALALGIQGKIGEAEQIIRRDLPPELAEQNLNWLRQQTANVQPQSTSPASAGRTWSSLEG